MSMQPMRSRKQRHPAGHRGEIHRGGQDDSVCLDQLFIHGVQAVVREGAGVGFGAAEAAGAGGELVANVEDVKFHPFLGKDLSHGVQCQAGVALGPGAAVDTNDFHSGSPL